MHRQILATVRDFADTREIHFNGVPPGILNSSPFNRCMDLMIYKVEFRSGAAGYARYHRKIIELNAKLFTEGSPADVQDTFLHELAHFLTLYLHGKNCHHNLKWCQAAHWLGASTLRCHSYPYLKTKHLPRNIIYDCLRCGCTYHQARQLKNDGLYHYCRKCSGKLLRRKSDEEIRLDKVSDDLDKYFQDIAAQRSSS